MESPRTIVALAGGVGGARFLEGLAGIMPGPELTAIVNTGDDFLFHGLHVSPDVDTVTYTLAGIANPHQGWGILHDTRATLDGMTAYGEDPWFLVGDRDFATHILRTERLRAGQTLSQVTADLAGALGVRATLLPMTNQIVQTEVLVADGWLGFQDYFVGRRHVDTVLEVRFAGIAEARPSPGVVEAIAGAELIVICPSNPVVSIQPILDIAGVRDAVAAAEAPVVCISPIIGGKAVKGPAAGMLEMRGVPATALGVAEYYRGLVDIMVIDEVDAAAADAIRARGMDVVVLQTLMGDHDDRIRLAREVLGAITA